MSIVREIFKPKFIAEGVQLGTVIALSLLALKEKDSDNDDTTIFTYQFAAQMFALTYSASKYFEQWGMENEAESKDDLHFPTQKPDKRSSCLVRHQRNLNKVGSTGTLLGLMGLVAGGPEIQTASAVFTPVAAAASTSITALTTHALEKIRIPSLSQANPPQYHRLDEEKGETPVFIDHSGDILTLRNAATFIIIASTLLLSYFAIEKNDMSSDKVITFSLLAKIMNIGLTVASDLKSFGIINEAHAYDDKINPTQKSPVTSKQNILKWASVGEMTMSALGVTGLFAGTEKIRNACAVLTPVMNGATQMTASSYAHEVRTNAHAPRRG